MTYTDWIGSVGVAILLAAFFLNLFNTLNKGSLIYLLLNIVGALLACYASLLLRYTPFVILEATWAGVSILGLIRHVKGLR